ncbi:phosphoenolpyruvate carboxykinase 1 [Actinidia rufa]|uniref:Phosphoenolpyruvate carboxykinase 1 n=1 Tax=Actinidia rufa TaxID=165716 RepID=A0A7J0H745_9ERIC|nr:phosphoenolpyruvate carboxykinase 1 [Actinidia rufa]
MWAKTENVALFRLRYWKDDLSTDHNRYLIGDDAHCGSDNGVSNIEGGCYAKCIDLAKQEPDIWNAIEFGTDNILTSNARVAYPIEYIPNAKIPCVGPHPKNVILLACDAFGVLPPVTGTEDGIKEPQATFSACLGAVFIMLHPIKYAAMLAAKKQKHGATGWLVNTGWSGGRYGSGSRIKLAYTRKIIDAIHSGSLLKWTTMKAYKETLLKLGGLFKKNFEVLVNHKIGKDDKLTEEILASGLIF